MVFPKNTRARNNLPCTNIDNLLPDYNLSTAIKQVTTYTDGLFNYAEYLHSLMQPLGCMKPESTFMKRSLI